MAGSTLTRLLVAQTQYVDLESNQTASGAMNHRQKICHWWWRWWRWNYWRCWRGWGRWRCSVYHVLLKIIFKKEKG
jgi:hypothetical protein